MMIRWICIAILFPLASLSAFTCLTLAVACVVQSRSAVKALTVHGWVSHILGLYCGYLGIMEKKMETTIVKGLGFRVILGLWKTK